MLILYITRPVTIAVCLIKGGRKMARARRVAWRIDVTMVAQPLHQIKVILAQRAKRGSTVHEVAVAVRRSEAGPGIDARAPRCRIAGFSFAVLAGGREWLLSLRAAGRPRERGERDMTAWVGVRACVRALHIRKQQHRIEYEESKLNHHW